MKINNKDAYSIDNQLSLDDFLIGSDADNADKTRNYLLRGIFSTFKTSLNLTSIEFTFSAGTDPDIDHTDQGFFTTNSNQTSFGAITSVLINKLDLNGIDISSVIDVISQNTSSFTVRFSKPSSTGQVFYFAINSIVDSGTHYILNVTPFVGGTALVDETTYGLNFDLSGVPSILTESDPIFSASPAGSITNTNVSQWNSAFGWGDHASVGYLTSVAIGDVTGFTDNSSNWNTAFGWGNHADVGYLTSFSESDPVYSSSPASGITSILIGQWNLAYSWGDHSTAGYIVGESDPVFLASVAASITSAQVNNWNAAYSWGDHGVVGYLTSESDPVFSASVAAGIITSDITNWNSAFGWGDHGVVGYELQSNKGIANGYAPLNGSGVIDSQYLPAFVDDVLEFANLASFPVTGETGKLYIALDSNFTYRWSGSTYIQVGGGGAGAVDSVFGRVGGVVAQVGDYSSFYVQKTGDTMTGNLTINSTSFLLDSGTTYGQIVQRREVSAVDYESALAINGGSGAGLWTWNGGAGTATYLEQASTGLRYYNGSSYVFEVGTDGGIDTSGQTLSMNYGNKSRIDFLNLTNADQSVRLEYEASDGNLISGGYALRIVSQNAIPQSLASLEVEGRIGTLGGFISATRAGGESDTYRALFGNSGTTNNFLFGGSTTGSATAMDTFLRVRTVAAGDLLFQEDGNSHTIWHSGNDGDGSALDADLYKGLDLGASGAWWNAMTRIQSNGVMEVGRYIDFHRSNTGTTDYDARLDNVAVGHLRLTSTNTSQIIEAYNSSTEFAQLQANASGGALILSDDTLTNTILRGYGDSEFYGGGVEVYNGQLLTGNTSGGFNGQLTVAKNDGGSMVLTHEDDYLRWRRSGGGTILGWRWDSFDTTVMTLTSSTGLTVVGDIFANGTKYEGDNKEIIRFSDAWLRLNPANEFTSGIYMASSIARTDNQFQVGSGGSAFYANSSGDVRVSGAYMRNNHNTGYLEGSYNNVGANNNNTNPIYVIGSSYVPTTTALSNMYGIGYSNGSATFLNSTDLGTNPAGWGMYVAADGNARIFLNATNGHIYAGGNMYADNFILSSDITKKTNIENIEETFDVRWRSFEMKKELGEIRYGVIAQELQETHPQFVHDDGTGNLSVRYIDLLVAKMAEKDKQIDNLEERIERLEKAILG